MCCLEYKHGDFEDDSLFDWEPVELFEDKCDVSDFLENVTSLAAVFYKRWTEFHVSSLDVMSA